MFSLLPRTCISSMSSSYIVVFSGFGRNYPLDYVLCSSCVVLILIAFLLLILGFFRKIGVLYFGQVSFPYPDCLGGPKLNFQPSPTFLGFPIGGSNMVSPYVWCRWGNSPVDVTPPQNIGQNCHDGFLFFQCFSNIRVQDSDHAIAIVSIYIWSKRSQSSECVCESKRNFKADKTYLLFTEELHRQTCTWTCSWFTLCQVGHGVQFNGPIIMICIKKIWVLSLCWAPITSFLTFVWWCCFFHFFPHMMLFSLMSTQCRFPSLLAVDIALA